MVLISVSTPSQSSIPTANHKTLLSRIQQYHSALLLLMEIFAFPNRKEADRIWRCLDYVFEIPPHIPKDQKGRWVMSEVRDKMGIYIASRKVMAPSSMLERIGSHSPRTTSTASTPPSSSVGKVGQSSVEFAHGYTQAPTQYIQGAPELKPDPMTWSGTEQQATMQMPPPPAQPEIDWVRTELISTQVEMTDSRCSASGTSYFHQM